MSWCCCELKSFSPRFSVRSCGVRFLGAVSFRFAIYRRPIPKYLVVQPLIDRLNSATTATSFLYLFMDNPETSSPNSSTISPILLHSPIPTFRFRYISRVSHMILKEFGFEFVPYNQIRLSLVHVLCLGLFGLGVLHGLGRLGC